MTQSQPPQNLPRTDAMLYRWTIVVAVILLLLLCYWLRYVLTPFIVAGALAFIIRPVVRVLERRMPHGLAVTIVYVIFLVLVAALFWWVQSVVVPDSADFAARLPRILRKLLTEVFRGEKINVLGREWDAGQLSQQIIASAGQWLSSPSAVYGLVETAFGAFMGLILTLVLMCYFLLGGKRLAEGMLWLVPPLFRPQVRTVAMRVRPVLRRYIIGLIVIVIYAFFLSWIATGVLYHLRNAVILSLAVALLELIPVVGPATSIILICAVAIEHGTLPMLVGFAIFIIALRLSIDQLVGPLVLGRAVTLHPVVIIFAFLAGGTLFGIIGVLVAIPVAATIKLVLEYWYEEAG